jgi:hypothetical protein
MHFCITDSTSVIQDLDFADIVWTHLIRKIDSEQWNTLRPLVCSVGRSVGKGRVARANVMFQTKTRLTSEIAFLDAK